MRDCSFRPLARDDLDSVTSLVVACDALVADWAPVGWELPADWAHVERRTWEEDLADEAMWSEVAVEEGGNVIGVVASAPDGKFGGAPGTGRMVSLFVAPELHGRGLGGRLVERSDAWMRDQGMTAATLDVLEGSPAVGFYRAHGWRPDGRRGRFEAFGLPTIGLGKRL